MWIWKKRGMFADDVSESLSFHDSVSLACAGVAYAGMHWRLFVVVRGDALLR